MCFLGRVLKVGGRGSFGRGRRWGRGRGRAGEMGGFGVGWGLRGLGGFDRRLLGMGRRWGSKAMLLVSLSISISQLSIDRE